MQDRGGETPKACRRIQFVAVAAACALAGCMTSTVAPATTAASAASGSAAGEGSSTGAGAVASSGGTTAQGLGSTSGGSGSGSGGSSTGSPASPYVDGGYVFCSLPNADGGPARWLCQPGTYFCDPSGNPGTCFQCRSDADCADRSLPTYDPLRPRCDLDSGLGGYQGFCQECLDNADCAGSPAGMLCDLNPAYPPNGLEPPVEALGFESCGRVQTDCRQEGGPPCSVSNQVCDPFNGQCEARSPSCTTDQDCAGLLVASGSSRSGSPYLPNPYCVDGGCTFCSGGVCPNNNACRSDSDCGNPTGSPSGPTCQPFADGSFQCACTSSAQCSGFWPACTGLDAGNLDDAGQAIGVCSCDSDSQCGDAGLACLAAGVVEPAALVLYWPSFLASIFGDQAGSNFCGVPCTSPAFSSCAALTGVDICNLTLHLCSWCVTDEECESSVGSGGAYCDGEFVNMPPPPGFCGCILDSDCPDGDSCLSYESHSTFLGTCVPTFSRCTPESCGGFFCNWDSGACVNDSNAASFPSCVNDADCSNAVCFEGACVECPGCTAAPGCSGSGCRSCSSPLDCPDDQGCDSQSHTCGTCRGPTAHGGPNDCPPDAVCSNYWLGTVGACLPNCDREE